MADDISLPHVSHPESAQCVAHEAGAPQTLQWQPADTSLLQPSNLSVPKPLRAWDRKPLSPFSRQRLRVGKVWKRPAMSTRYNLPSQDDGGLDVRASKRRKARASLMQGERKPVKKLCLDEGFGMGASVVGWDVGEGSPVRKIVTRSSLASSGEEIIALPDEDDELVVVAQADVGEEAEEEEQGVPVTVEILDEDGTLLEVNPEDGGKEPDWEDEAPGGGDSDNEADDSQPTPAEFTLNAVPVEPSGDDGEQHSLPDSMEHQIEAQRTCAPAFSTVTDGQEITGDSQQGPSRQPQEVVLPDGFVSPVKRPLAKIGKRFSLGSSRRRTLPVQFAPSLPILAHLDVSDEGTAQPAQSGEDGHEMLDVELITARDVVSEVPVGFGGVIEREAQHFHEIANEKQQDDGEWEDVGSESSEDDSMEVDDGLPTAPAAPTDALANDNDGSAQDEASRPAALAPDHDTASTKLPSSPVPTIEGQHPRLPLRRSPRRKSSSPLKQSTILPSTDKPHLVAFTPIKDFAPYFTTQSQQVDESGPVTPEHTPSGADVIQRAASEPPLEDTQISPRKPSRPRVSDDTALLQAFLHRAAESKGSRRVSSTSQKESVENRRDSDAVRQALASPAAKASVDVLGELDPNSPSPRKSSTPALDQSNVFDEVIAEAARKAEEEGAGTGDEGSRTRRSGRATKKTQTPTTVPNKIAIRPNAEAVVLKRSEAQELALLTRNNTRKNKGGSVLPPLRLTKMALQFGNVDSAEDENVEENAGEKPEGERGVRWAETLVEFYQGGSGEVSEVSVLSDELNGPTPASAEGAEKVEGGVKDASAPSSAPTSAPPPSETPSKPKIRKLKAPRTAAAPGKTASTAAPPPASDKPAPSENASSSKTPAQSKLAAPAATTTKRRSRIATPAKGLLSNASLLPADFEPQPVVPAPQSQQTRKTAVSKLPAPASASASLSASFLGSGKENTASLLASPPKKKAPPPPATGGLPSAKAFAPKLDLGSGKAKLDMSSSSLGRSADEGVVPGLSSPAKKGGRTRMIAGLGGKGEGAEGSGVGKRLDFEPSASGAGLGLSSPAKKRTRRAV